METKNKLSKELDIANSKIDKLERKLYQANNELESIKQSFENWDHKRQSSIHIMTTGPSMISIKGNTLMQGEQIEIHGWQHEWDKFEKHEYRRSHISGGDVRKSIYGPGKYDEPYKELFYEPGVINIKFIHLKPEDENSERCPECESLRWHERYSFSSGNKIIKECFSCMHRWDAEEKQEETKELEESTICSNCEYCFEKKECASGPYKLSIDGCHIAAKNVDTGVYDLYVGINYCPFCGTKL